MNIEQFAEVKTMLTDIAAAKAEWQRAAGGSIGEVAAGWLAPYYLLSVRGQLTALPEGPERFKLLRLAIADAVILQRGGHAGDWLQLEQERLEFNRQKHRDTLAAAQTAIQKLRDPKLPLTAPPACIWSGSAWRKSNGNPPGNYENKRRNSSRTMAAGRQNQRVAAASFISHGKMPIILCEITRLQAN